MTTLTPSPYEKHLPLAQRACSFLTSSPDPYHVVVNGISMLQKAGYVRLNSLQPFATKIVAGGKYYYDVDGTTLVAFAVGGKYEPGNGFKIIGGHTDSPNLRVKPQSRRGGGDGGGPSGCIQLGVETYGGGLWHTWFDRDLGVSGSVLVRDDEASGGGKIARKLVKIDRPIARISSLAIHLQTAEERKAFAVNKEDHLSPILATVLKDGAKEQLTGSGGDGDAGESSETEGDVWSEGHEPLLLSLLASELKIPRNRIADFDLNLFDVQPASLGGIRGNDFLHSGRLDNLATCFVALESLVAHSSDEGRMETDGDVCLVALFDHEEVGSESFRGAGSPVVTEAVRWISSALSKNGPNVDPDLQASTVGKSFVLSVDMAHAVHPNYASKHESNHGPKLNGGMVIKTNRNQRYATDAVSGFVVRELARRSNLLAAQEFVVRNDCGCGSTIGPTIAAETGMRVADIGMPQLSMHSCRETMGVADLTNCLDLFTAFFERFREIDDDLLEGRERERATRRSDEGGDPTA